MKFSSYLHCTMAWPAAHCETSGGVRQVPKARIKSVTAVVLEFMGNPMVLYGGARRPSDTTY